MVWVGEDRMARLDGIPARYEVIVTVRLKCACAKGRTGVVQAKAPAYLPNCSRPTGVRLARSAASKDSEHLLLNGQAVVKARHGENRKSMGHAARRLRLQWRFTAGRRFLLSSWSEGRICR